MKTVIIKSTNYEVTAKVTPVPKSDLFELVLTSTLATAKNPDEERKIGQMFLTKQGIRDFSTLLATVA
jgi:hypothetical protein